MRNLPSEVDVAVIGAGSAGIAAGRRLARAEGVSVLVLEARERAGGRTWTVEKNGYPLDLGGEWLHSADRNVLTTIAEDFGFEIYQRRPDWTTRLRNRGSASPNNRIGSPSAKRITRRDTARRWNRRIGRHRRR
jgi:monoamine oxidase